MAKRIDMTGKVFGHLTVVGLTEKVKGVRARHWIVECTACGGGKQFAGTTLRAGQVTSCGCKPRLNLGGFNLAKKMKATGQKLCKSLPDNRLISSEVRFFLEPSGKVVRKDAAEAVIAAGEVAPAMDGLFAGTDQTWTAAA